MQQRFPALRAAVKPARAARRGLARNSHDRRPADRALLGHGEAIFRLSWPFALYSYHFRNYIACATNDDGVANPDILAPQLILVMQRGVRNGSAADEDRL